MINTQFSIIKWSNISGHPKCLPLHRKKERGWGEKSLFPCVLCKISCALCG